MSDNKSLISPYDYITKQKNTEKELREILGATVDGIWTWNFKTNKLFFSNRYYKMLGYKPQEFKATYENWARLIHPDDKEKALGIAEKYLKNKPDVYNNEFRLKTKDGNYRWIKTKGKVVERDSKGKAVRMIGNHEDITDRKRMEESLKESEEKYRRYIDNAPEGVFIADEQGNYLEVNDAAVKITGYSKKELLNMNIADIASEKGKENALKHFKNLKKTGFSSGEKLFIHKNGSKCWWNINAVKLSDKRFIYFTIDITERKKIEKDLKISEENYKTVFNSSTDSIFIHDFKTGEIVDVNDTVVKRFGYSKDKFKELNVGDLSINKPPYTQKEAIKWIRKAAKEGPQRFEWHAKSKNGSLIWYENTLKLVDISGKKRVLVIGRDITERKKSEEDLKQREEIFSTIVETAPSLLLIADKNGNNTYISPNVKEYTGYSTKDFIGKVKWWIHPDDFEKVKYNFDKTFKEHISGKNLEYKAIKKNGEIWYASSSWEPLKDADGNFNGIVMQTLDITEKMKREQELKKGLMKYDLKEGYLYLEFEKTPTKTITALKDMVKTGYDAIIFSRIPEKQFKDDIKNKVNYFWISDRNEKNSIKISEIVKNIEKQIKNKVIFINRFDYIISKLGFKKALNFIQEIQEIAYIKNHTIFISLDDDTINKIEKTKIRKETNEIEPKLKIPIEEDLKEILEFVYNKNLNGIKPNYNEVGEKLYISKPTTRNRVKRLVQNGYIIEKTKGRRKILEVTDKTRNIFD